MLSCFSIFYNNIEGNIRESIGHLKGLSFFSVAANKLIGMVPSSLYNVSISILSIAKNQLSGTLPTNIAPTLPNLQQFLIGVYEFFGPIPHSLCNASLLQNFNIGENNLAGSVPNNLRNILNLERLALGRNNLGRDLDFLTSLRNYSKLKMLDFDENQFEGVLPN